MRVRLHPDAVADLTSAGDWYELQVAGLGADLAGEVERALRLISAQPTVWPPWPGLAQGLDVRRFLLARFPFAIAFMLESDEVVVLAIAHLRRRPGYWLGRRPPGR
jgi:plasmid stabilization system protein ParE